MSKKEVEFVAGLFKTEEGGTTFFDQLERMHKASTINIVDSAVVTKDDKGKLHVKETREVTGKEGFVRGALVTGALAVIYPPSILASALAGGIAGGAWGKLRDTGIKTDVLKGIGDALEPGNSAVVVLAEPESLPEIRQVMSSMDQEFIREAASGTTSK